MVRKTFCDRCEKEIPKDLDNELSFTRVRRTRHGIDEVIHLCDLCLDELCKFIKKELKR